MPERRAVHRARRARREGKRPTTQAREFLREEIHHVPRRQAWRALDEASYQGKSNVLFRGCAPRRNHR